MELKIVCVDDFFGHQTQLEMNCRCVDWILDFVAGCVGKTVCGCVADVDEEGEDDSGVELTGTMEE